MPRLNDEFMEVLTTEEGTLKPGMEPMGYQLLRLHERDGLAVDIHLNPWLEPGISTRGSFKGHLLKGGVYLAGGVEARFVEGGLHQKGLIMGIEDEYGDRKYWIADSDTEEVQVTFWDTIANTPDPQDGSLGGQYGEYVPVPEKDAEIVKKIASGMIAAAKIAVDAQSSSS